MSEDNKTKTPNFVEKPLIPMLHDNHKLPTTRRDFISQGLMAAASSVVLPSFASLVSQTAFANNDSASCELPQFNAGLPYLCIDAGGGMNIAAANVIVGLRDGGDYQEDVEIIGSTTSDFIRLGISPEEHPRDASKIIDTYKLKMHRASGVLQGMNNILEPEGTQRRMLGEGGADLGPISNGVDGLIFCTRTADDTANNQINTVYMANKAGAKGELVQMIGTGSGLTAARSAAPQDQIDLKIKPSQVNSGNQAAALLSLGSTLSGEDYLNGSEDGERVKRFMDRIGRMSRTKLDHLSQQGSLGQIQSVLNCSYDNAKQLFDKFTAAQLDPSNDAAVSEAFDGGPMGGAAVCKLVLDKTAGAGTIGVGGCDYHNNGMQRTHSKDVEVGELIGRCILAASLKQENLAIHLYTDGGVSADQGGRTEPAQTLFGEIPKVVWTGDSGTRSSQLLIVYKHGHDGSPLVRDDAGGVRRQLGNFVRLGGVQQSSVIGDSTVNCWKAVMLNYLACQGREGEFESIFGSGSLPPDWESLVRFKPIV